VKPASNRGAADVLHLPEDARWNADRQAVEFRVEIGGVPRCGASGNRPQLDLAKSGGLSATTERDRGFADSPLEGDGFELPVPGREPVRRGTGLKSRKRERTCSGTEGSNPSPSSGESATNRFRGSISRAVVALWLLI